MCAEGDNLNNCVTRLSDLFGSDETLIYHHNGTLENGIDDGSYRYAGASDKVNNFVCFGSDEEKCPNNNLYRIIGVIDGKVKLIKYDYATKEDLGEDGAYAGLKDISDCYKGEQTESIASYHWDRGIYQYENTTWNSSYLNTINLNTNYLNTFLSKWQNLILVTDWNIGAGNVFSDFQKPVKIVYQNEILNPKFLETIQSKIGLVYETDYGLSAWNEAWGFSVHAYGSVDVYPKNWMYMGMTEWILTSFVSSSDNLIFSIAITEHAGIGSDYPNFNLAVRPVFFLVDNSFYSLGNGTKENPIRIN